MATTKTFTATTLTTPYYASKARYATDAAVQGARWRNSSSQQMVGFVGIPSLANVSWGGKIIDSASLTVTTRSLTQYDTIRLYGSNYNTYAYSTQKYGYEYVYTAGGYTDIALGTSATGEHTVTLTASNISWLLNTLRDGKTAFAMYYDGDTATSSQTYSEHSYGCTAFALSITYSDAKSTIDSVTDSEVGSATTLTWTNYATTGRTCKVRFTLGSADSGEITASGSSYSYTLPSSWYNELSTSTSGTATAYLYTYINGTLIGTETETFTASVPSSVVPTIGSISATKYNSNETVATWDIWLQNYTQAVIAVSGCTAGTGATIASYSFSGQNLTSTVTTTEASASATSSAIQVSGELTYTVKITDSRGRTATATVDVTVLAYAAPNISTATATRCDSDGTVNTVTGVYGKARFKYTYTSIGSNAVTTRISYKLASASTYTTVQENIASWTWSSVFGTLDIASAYDVQTYIVDSLGNSSTYITQISTVSGIAFGLKNDRARFGGAVQKAGLQVDWPTEIDNNLTIKTNNAYPLVITDADGAKGFSMINYNGVTQFSTYNEDVERNYIGDGRFSTYDSTGTEVDRVSAGGSFFGSDVNHTGALTVNNNPVVLTVNSTAPDANGNVDVSGGSSGNIRSCSASLSSAGWYRVLTANFGTSALAQGSSGMLIDFNIVREGTSASAESHIIKYQAINSGSGIFDIETSNCGTMYISDIRYTYDSTSGYVDIYYTGTSANTVTVYFSATVNPSYQSLITANSLESVDNAPSGETIQTTYGFSKSAPARLYAAPAAVSCASGSNITVASVTCQPGTWIFCVTAQWASNSSGRRKLFLSNANNSSSDYGIAAQDWQGAINGSVTYCSFTYVDTFTNTRTYYLNEYQDSGSNLTVRGRITAIKV